MTKLYLVTVTVELELPVVAESKEDAHSIAIDHWHDELDLNGFPEFYIREAQERDLPAFAGECPYGDTEGLLCAEHWQKQTGEAP